MKAQQLIRDPLFQLNLLLWMSREQPEERYVVRPVFWQHGFRLIYIEQPFPLPRETMEAIADSQLEISQHPEPELLLGNMPDRRALYFEAKAESFSPDSSNAKQARGHLLATGDAFAEVMTPLESCLLCYVIPDERRSLMSECLVELSEEMTREHLSSGRHSVHGLSVRGRDLEYTWDAEYRAFAGVESSSSVVMSDLDEDTDPSPLFLVYSIEDYPDPERQDLLRRVLVNQVHALLVCDLNALEPNKAHSMDAESLLMEMTDGVLPYLGKQRQKGMRRLVRNNVLRRIEEYATGRFDDVVSYERATLRICFPNRDRKTAFLDWLEDLSKTRFSFDKSPDEDRPLFRNLPDEEDE